MAKVVTDIKQHKRAVIRPTTRKSRAINFAYNSIPLQSGATENCLLHKHMNGYLLIELNGRNEPVRAWRDCDGIFPIRSRQINTKRIAHLVNRIKPKVLYMNDGEPLQTLFSKSAASWCVKPYCGSLIDLLSDIRVTKNLDDDYDFTDDVKISFQDVLLLDPTISYKEYCSIYRGDDVV